MQSEPERQRCHVISGESAQVLVFQRESLQVRGQTLWREHADITGGHEEEGKPKGAGQRAGHMQIKSS